MKDGFFLAVFCIVYAWFVFYIPNYLGHADNYIPANPAVTPTHIVPEWYYLPFYAILRAIPDKLIGVIALFASIVVLAFLPWLDTSRVRSARYRPLYRQFFWLFVIVCVGLGWLGSKPPEGGYVIAGAHLHRLLLRLLPDHPAAARHLRENQAAAELDFGIGPGREGVSGSTVMKMQRTMHRSRALLAASVALRSPGVAEEHDTPTPPRLKWSFAGPFGKFDQAQLQRGFKV